MALRQTMTVTERYANTLQTDSTVFGVSVYELKNHLRIAGDDEDEYLMDLIWQTTKYIEDKHSIAFFDQTWKLSLDGWPGYTEPWWDGTRQIAVTELTTRGKPIVIPRYPLSSITSITVYDEEGNSTAITPSTYFDIDTDSKRGRLKLKAGQTFPTATRTLNAIEIVYVAGYGSTKAALPVGLKRALLEMASHLYTHRGDCSCEDAYRKTGVQGTLSAYVVTRF